MGRFYAGVLFVCWNLIYSSMMHEREEQEPVEIRKIDPGIIHLDICRQHVVDKSADCSSRSLYEVPQRLFPDIETLILTENELGVLGPASFRRYLQLKVLYLDKNCITSIARDTFYSLQRLERLVLSQSCPMRFSPGIFRKSHNLKYLDQSSNSFYHYDYDIVNLLPKLRTLNLMSNALSSIDVPPCHGKREKLVIDVSKNSIAELSPRTVDFGCQVDVLVLDGNPLRMIHPVTIASLPIRSLSLGNYQRPPEVLKSLFLGVSMSGIEELSIRNAGITHIPSDTFDPLQNKSLSLLDLSGNYLILYPFVFGNLSLVSALSFTDSIFTTIIPEYFYGMSGLRNLTLGSSAVTEINPHKSVWKTNLTLLEIRVPLHKRRDSLGKCSLNPFVGLNHLKILNFIDRDSSLPVCETYKIPIDSDYVEYINLGVSRGKYYLLLDTPNAKEISCFGTESSPGFSFQFSPSREDNMLPEKIQVSHAGVMETSIFQEFPQGRTVYLNMSYNQIAVIPSGDFDNYSSLESLDLKENIIALIASDAFVGLVSLKSLYLDHNRICYVSDNTFRETRKLQTLNLDRNNLYYLDKDLFSHTSMLATLSLSSNQLSDFNRSTFQVIRSSIENIDISLNFVICSCESAWFINEFEDVLINEDTTFCSRQAKTLHHLRGKPLAMFEPRDYCYPNVLRYTLMFLAVTVTFLVAILVYRNSRQAQAPILPL